MLSKPESVDKINKLRPDEGTANSQQSNIMSSSQDNIQKSLNIDIITDEIVATQGQQHDLTNQLKQQEVVVQLLTSYNQNVMKNMHEQISVDITPDKEENHVIQHEKSKIEQEDSQQSMSLDDLQNSSSDGTQKQCKVQFDILTSKYQKDQEDIEKKSKKVNQIDTYDDKQDDLFIQTKVQNFMSKSVAIPNSYQLISDKYNTKYKEDKKDTTVQISDKSSKTLRQKKIEPLTNLLKPSSSDSINESEDNSIENLPSEPRHQRIPAKLNVATVHGAGTFNLISNHSARRLQQLPRLSARDFEVEAFLGGGNVGSVYLVKKKPDVLISTARGVERFALKAMSLADLRARGKLRRLRTECEILLSANHPFITQLHGVFADTRNVYLLLDFCKGGELAFHLRRAPMGRFTEKQALQVAAEVLSALEYLHFKGVMYRDMKTENVLVGADGHVRLADFDLAKRSQLNVQLHQYAHRAADTVSGYKSLHYGAINTLFQCESASLVGTAEYLAPETLNGQHTQLADFWALGILIYEMIFGTTPFYQRAATQASIMKRIREGDVHIPPVPKVSKHCKDLILRLLERDVTKRLGSKAGAADIKQHPWFRKVDFAVVYAPPVILEQWIPPPNDPQQPEPLESILRCFRRRHDARADQATVQQLIGTGFTLPPRLAGSARVYAENCPNKQALRVVPLDFDQIWDDGIGLFCQSQNKQQQHPAAPKRVTLEELRKGFAEKK